jgi:hypothetical protein
MYNEAFPVVEDRKNQKDRNKPWLDDHQFKERVMEKGELYSKKVKGQERDGDRERLAEVTREVNKDRPRLKKAYFSQRLEEVVGDARATWEVLSEVLGPARKGGETRRSSGFSRRKGWG